MRRTWLLAAGLITATFLAGTATAFPAHKHVTLEGDNGEGCLDQQKNDCFRVVNGSMDGFVAGMRIHLTLVNVGSAPHNVYVTEEANADQLRIDTAGDDAINNTATIDPDANASTIFDVPDDAEGLYFWCDIDGHEAGGMWITASVEQPVDEPPEGGTGGANDTGNDSDGDAGGSDGDDESAVPAPGGVAVVATVVSTALVAASRRR